MKFSLHMRLWFDRVLFFLAHPARRPLMMLAHTNNDFLNGDFILDNPHFYHA